MIQKMLFDNLLMKALVVDKAQRLQADDVDYSFTPIRKNKQIMQAFLHRIQTKMQQLSNCIHDVHEKSVFLNYFRALSF